MLEARFDVCIGPSRQYLLDITQHAIGGFGKVAQAPPDIYHSYLGLAALATMGDDDLKDFDVGLCCTMDTTRKIEKARDGLLQRGFCDWDDDFWSAEL
jgi:geranylgeranyl transferase type-1 subunit beta